MLDIVVDIFQWVVVELKVTYFTIIIIIIIIIIANIITNYSAEQGLTNKQVFQSLKTKFNEKAKIPGFFEVGEHTVCITSNIVNIF